MYDDDFFLSVAFGAVQDIVSTNSSPQFSFLLEISSGQYTAHPLHSVRVETYESREAVNRVLGNP